MCWIRFAWIWYDMQFCLTLTLDLTASLKCYTIHVRISQQILLFRTRSFLLWSLLYGSEGISRTWFWNRFNRRINRILNLSNIVSPACTATAQGLHQIFYFSISSVSPLKFCSLLTSTNTPDLATAGSVYVTRYIWHRHCAGFIVALLWQRLHSWQLFLHLK